MTQCEGTTKKAISSEAINAGGITQMFAFSSNETIIHCPVVYPEREQAKFQSKPVLHIFSHICSERIPRASFTYSPETPESGEHVIFDGSSSSDPDGEIVSYEWDFGDGSTDSGSIVSHVFTTPGTYTVNLTVTDNDGMTDSLSIIVEILQLKVTAWTSGHFVSNQEGWNSSAAAPIHVQVLDYLDKPVQGAAILLQGTPYGQSDINGRFDLSWPVPDSPPVEGPFTSKVEARWYNLSGESELVTLYNVEKLPSRTATLNAGEAAMYNATRLLEYMVPTVPSPPGWVWDLFGAVWNFLKVNLGYSARADDVVTVETYKCTASNVAPAWLIRDTIVRDGQLFLERNSWTESQTKFLLATSPIPPSPYLYRDDGMLIYLLSPAILYITAPDGSHAGYDPLTRELLFDFPVAISDPGDEPFLLFIPHPANGDYLIYVIPEPDASPTDTFTLVVNRDETDRVLAQDVQVQDIPVMPYVVTGLDSITVDVEIEPETLNLSSEGNWITCYIQFPEAYYIANIDSSTILLNGEIPSARLFAGDEEDIEQILMVKFDRSDLQKIIQPGNVELIVTGELLDGTTFECRDTIRVIE